MHAIWHKGTAHAGHQSICFPENWYHFLIYQQKICGANLHGHMIEVIFDQCIIYLIYSSWFLQFYMNTTMEFILLSRLSVEAWHIWVPKDLDYLNVLKQKLVILPNNIMRLITALSSQINMQKSRWRKEMTGWDWVDIRGRMMVGTRSRVAPYSRCIICGGFG